MDNCYYAKILADSISPWNCRLTTFEVCYPRFVHSELMTHRMFCLTGDSKLEFNMPAGQGLNKTKRIYSMTIAEFVDKWNNGSKPHKSRWGTVRRYDLKKRLKKMQIRQLNEATGEISFASVADACFSGTKQVYEVIADKYKIAGSIDHKILTTIGWKTIGELRIGNEIIVSTSKKPLILKSNEYKYKKINGQWRSSWQNQQRKILFEENPKCRQCNINLGSEIHHKISVHENPDLVFDVNNVTLLCDDCHKFNHQKQGWQTGNYLYAGTAVIKSIVCRGIEQTYDLSITGPFANFLANKVVVHNSRNSASSRAIPNEKLRERVQHNPALPVWWGKNVAGMQAPEELSDKETFELIPVEDDPRCLKIFNKSPKKQAKDLWFEARDLMLEYSEKLAKVGLHKQLCNRLIEPWMPITVIISATEWANFFHLRCHKDAQPEIKFIAEMMRDLYRANVPKELQYGKWHMPLIFAEDLLEKDKYDLRKISVGRCARVSYLTHDGKRELEKDIELCDRLAASGHWSPFEHVASCPTTARENDFFGSNFKGWRQFRKNFQTENFQGPI